MSPQLSAARLWVLSAVGVVAAGAVGATLALTGVVHNPTLDAPFTEAVVDSRMASASACAGGPVVATLHAGQRVLVVENSADGGWVGVRNPSNPSQTLWLEQAVVTPDDADSSAVVLPVGGKCPTTSIEVGFADAESEPGTPSTPENPGVDKPGDDKPATDPGSPPAADTAKPKLSAPKAQPDLIACSDGYPYPTSSTISVTAQDNVAVTRVDISWTGSYSGSSTMSGNGSTWKFTFDATGPGDRGDVNFSMVARDAAGNRSAASTVSVFVDCLI